MKVSFAWIGVFFAIVAVVAAGGHSEPSCGYCFVYESCYRCQSSANVYCTDSWRYNSVCCYSGALLQSCTGTNCCNVTARILMYIGIAAGAVALFIGAFLLFWCIRTRRNRVEYEGFQQQPAEVVEVHHYQQPTTVQTTTTYGSVQPAYGQPAGVQVGYQAAPGYTY